jgi:1-acyl-sn-glycerol-3-phosphate acyltransferase
MKIYKNTTFILQSILCFIFNPLLNFFIHLKVRGLENLENLNEPYIIVSNHSSELDIIIILTIFYNKLKHKPLFCVTREKSYYKDAGILKNIIYGGWFFKIFGGYQAYKGTGNYKKSLINHISIIKRGYSTCFFIEGTISKNGTLGRAKGGALFLSQKTGVPIIPVSINGLFGINFRDFIQRTKEAKVTISKPIEFSEYVSIYEPGNIYYYGEKSQIIMQIIKDSLW